MDFIGMVPLAEEDEAADLSRWIWVQCESPSCLKWRYIPKHEHFDPDKAWFCHMNPDPFFSQCTVPQVSSYKDSILRKKGLKVVYSKLPAGTLVLIKYSKWPLWPAILSPEPSTNQYVDCDGDGDVQQYHVEFLGKPHTRFWADAHKVESFRPLPTSVKSLKGTTRVSYKIAMEEAMDMRDLSCEERLQLCHFQREQL
ncbi:zinc finger CW-type PWWP domain protein 2 homolog isoform X2 [Engraulis encrasicolus]